jgi:hypothetical protein
MPVWLLLLRMPDGSPRSSGSNRLENSSAHENQKMSACLVLALTVLIIRWASHIHPPIPQKSIAWLKKTAKKVHFNL